MGRNIGKNISEILRSKCSQKPIDYVTDSFKTNSKRAIWKSGEITGDLIDNKIADKVSKHKE